MQLSKLSLSRGRLCANLLVSLGFAYPTIAPAFSLDTHLYVATKVLDDLQDGTVSICAGEELATAKPDSRCGRRYPVRPAIAAALKSNASAYLAGAMGPDVYPDFITSQVTVHPGIEHGWGTDDFLRHLLANAGSGADLAWTSGFASHASADIFAHSWVNHYAGGIFDLGAHSGSNEIEVRHFILERYIADRTPRVWSKYAEIPSAPHGFIADQLMLANPVSAQFKKNGATTAHIVAIEVLHENVGKLSQDALSISKKINEIAFVKLQPLESAKVQFKIAEEGLKIASKGLEEGENALRKRDELIASAERELINAAKIIDKNPGLIFGWRQQMETTKLAINAQESGVEGLRDAVRAATKVVEEAQKILNGIDSVLCEWLPWPFDDICELNPAYKSAEHALDLAKQALRVHENALNETLNLIAHLKRGYEELEQKVSQAEKAIAEARIAEQVVGAQLEIHRTQRKLEVESVRIARKGVDEATKVAQKAQELLEKLSRDLAPIVDLLARYNPIVLFLEHWHADLRRASMAFSGASQDVATHILAKKDGNALDPYVKWYQCWSPVLSAVPSEIPQTVCTANDIYKQLQDKLNSEINNVVDSLGSLGWLIAPNVKIQQEFEKKVQKPLENEVRKAATRAAVEIVAFLGNRELAELLELIASKDRITDERLNGIYATDDSNSRLLQIADVATRVRKDAGLSTDGDVVSEDRFPALYNAIVLSKLALLDADTLNVVFNDLARDVNPRAVPRKLFAEKPGQPFNLLLGGVASIDGNHQWQAVGLPYPVSSGQVSNWPGKSRFGRPGHSGAHSGFLLWGDVQAREVAFKTLFRGPLNPGLETHPAMVAAKYPFPSCDRNPFPSTTELSGVQAINDFTCRLTVANTDIQGWFPATTERRIGARELAHLNPWQLRIARNEIFARYGYTFGPQDLVHHFSVQPWYRPSDLPAQEILEKLSRTEWRNIALIRQAEGRLKAR